MPSVSISDPASIDRFEAIAGHATLAHYVRALHVRFGYYEHKLIYNIQTFAEHLVSVWRRSAPYRDTGKGATLSAKIYEDWVKFSRAEKRDIELLVEDGRESMKLLTRLHTEYQRRYEKQDRLWLNVLGRIATAMAWMPHATRLVMDDGHDIPLTIPAAATTNTPVPSPALSPERLIVPYTWATALMERYGDPPLEMALLLPAVLRDKGVVLTALRIHRLFLPSEFPLWPLPPDEDGEQPVAPPLEAVWLHTACDALRVFEFTPCYLLDDDGYDQWPTEYRRRLEGRYLSDVFEWILTASKHITHVSFDLKAMDDDHVHWTVMHGKHWPNLRVFHLYNSDLSVRTIPRFLAAAASSLTDLRLEGVQVTPVCFHGFPYDPETNSKVVDLLRARYLESGRNLRVQLRDPSGAELARRIAGGRLISDAEQEHLRSLFDSGEGTSSAVEDYIHGLGEVNPVVKFGDPSPPCQICPNYLTQ